MELGKATDWLVTIEDWFAVLGFLASRT